MRLLGVFLLCLTMMGCNAGSIYDSIPFPSVRYHDEEPLELESRAFSVTAFRDFCAHVPAAVLCSGNSVDTRLPLKVIYGIDVQLRGRFVYNTDWDLYHVNDLWQNWVISGDCEDYALTESELLSRFGQSAKDMRLILLKIHSWFGDVGHAMLAVRTADAGWVIIGVNAEERPDKGTNKTFFLPSKAYDPMIEIYMGIQRIKPFPTYKIEHDLILEKNPVVLTRRHHHGF